jgi:hypothetical protein
MRETRIPYKQEEPMTVETSTVPEPIADKVEVGGAAQAAEAAPEAAEERTWSEEFELAGSQLVEQVKEWIAEGNVRRIILRTPDNSLLLEIPLVAGAVVGGVLTIMAPLLAVLAAVASVLAHVKVEIIRVEEPTSKAQKIDP